MTHALEEANEINALGGGRIDVPATDNPDGLRVEFAWGTIFESGREPVGSLVVRAANLGAGPGGGTPIVEVEWTPDMSAAATGQVFTEALQRAGVYEGPESFSWPTALRELRDAVEIAVRGRRRAEGDQPHLHGELITTRGMWIFTTAGIEHLQRGLVVSEAAFPAPYGSPNVIIGPKPSFDPECPSWAAAEDWLRVITLGRSLYPRRDLPLGLYAHDGWVPRRRSATIPPD